MKPRSKERTHIVNFIKNLNEQDYANANRCLKNVVLEKIRKKIRLAATKPLFN